MVLMFLRDLVEQPPFAQVPQTFTCPMMKCYEKFTVQFQLIQHLLTCPELPNGEFDCDKCNNWHEFPTDEKDWLHWTGWRSQPSSQGPNIQRKTSLGSKMRYFTLRKKDTSRKPNQTDAELKQGFSIDTRPSTAVSEAPSTLSDRQAEQHMGFHGPTSFAGFQKPDVYHGLPEVDRAIFWPGFSPSQMESTVSSIAPSTFDTDPSKPVSQNTSQTTLFTPGLVVPYPTNTTSAPPSDISMPTQPFMFSPQPLHGGTGSLSGHRASISRMSLDEPDTPGDSAVESKDSAGWWGPKPEIETPRPTPPETCFHVRTPVAGVLAGDISGDASTPTSPCRSCVMDQRHVSPFYGMQQGSLNHPMSRALSQESAQVSMSTLYEPGLSEGNQIEGFSPHGDHSHHALAALRRGLESPTEELVCDECEWKPRGVRENLKGYLRKHKNTHKGARLACDSPGCTKTFSRLDNLKKHKKDKHDDPSGMLPLKRVAEDYAEHIEDDAEIKRPSTSELDIRNVNASGDYSMLWPALHF
ncbi:hypothetical protein B0T24DRAFT_641379 [Lasiosphaeria ovina]|uniref:C2H2-type domain-containing protein n=1 Tax=Lasiosphaeria ovina TaxID=92902 RepID=A0AAE0N096_9PEZI|nr:hypothetical protein B0T24DRAFT_641379 [Lasiosphaeria ovina]